MDNFDLKKYLVENKVTRNSRMLKEYFPRETQSLEQAFKQAGIDMNSPVEVVETGGGSSEPKKMDAKALLAMLKREKAEFEAESDMDAVIYDFDAEETYPGAKLAVAFSDSFEYVIYQ